MLLLLDGNLDLLEGTLGFEVLLALSFIRDVLVQVAREDGALLVLVETAAADLAHESREEVGRLLNDEEDHKDADAHRVDYGVHLPESLGVHAGHRRY